MLKRMYFLAAVGLAVLCLVSTWAYAAPKDFETPEYKSSTGLKSINASEAYALGFTGKGVVVGVVDSYFAPQSGEFAGKYPYGVFLGSNTDNHGIHVAGIIAAHKNGVGMHGTAFDASLLPFADLDYVPLGVTGWEKMLEFPDVRIVSNSWGNTIFPDQSTVFDTSRSYSEYYYDDDPLYGQNFLKNWLREEDHAPLVDVALQLAKADKLVVFAAGNEGHLSPSGEAALPTLVEKYGTADKPNPNTEEARDLKLHWLSVVAFDPAHVELKDGTWIPDGPAFPAVFTNMGLFASDYTLWAPGVDIYSTIGTESYGIMSGTSMAAPYVAGVAALTQSAFPYMGGKQIADVLLSTATKLDARNTPAVFILNREEYSDPDGKPLKDESGLRLYYDNVRRPSLSNITTKEHDALIAVIAAELKREGEDPEDAEVILTALLNNTDNRAVGLAQDDYLSLFGMGIVNAGKAVRGPGYFDANRLDNKDRKPYEINGTTTYYAMYPVDTKGYNSIWSNDIAQVQVGGTYPNGSPAPASNAFNSSLVGHEVGLLKDGAGRLYLTGKNTYAGPTVVAGGEISLGITGQDNQDARLAGSVYVEPAGTFSGNGYVAGSLDSSGTISPGLYSGPSDLTVNGSVTSSGKLLAHIWPEAGSANKLVAESGLVDIGGTRIDIAGMAGGGPLPSGSYVIIRAPNGRLTGDLRNDTARTMQGVTLLHDFSFSLTRNPGSLSADYRGTSVNPRSKALTEGYLGGTAMLNQGADLAAGAGLENAASAARSAAKRAAPGQAYGLSAFGAVSAGWSRYNTGSHVDVSGFSLLTGFSIGRELTPGFLSLGAFFEFGGGFYDTYNSFNNAASVRGDGETEYFGGGVLGRMDFARTGPGYFHAEASARTGMVLTDYEGTGLRDHTGRSAFYSSESAYYGLHAGLGYAWEMTDAAVLDLYGKYFWTRQAGDTVKLSSGESVRFKDTDSSRVRAGGRFSYTIDDTLTPYIGAAWEHEFDGMARATTNGFSLPSPTLRGDTGVGELGLSIKAGEFISLDLGVQGYSGKREGATGSAQVKIEF